MNNIEKINLTEVKKLISALLYLRGEEGLQPSEIQDVFGLSLPDTRSIFKKFKKEYNSNLESGLMIIEHADVFKIVTKTEMNEQISKFVAIIQRRRLSNQALETVAIVAYRQPISRNEISKIRGINSDGVISTLLTKNLIEEVDVQDESHDKKTILYGVTKKFYDYFVINSLDELPIIDEFKDNSENEVFDLMETNFSS